MNQIEQKMRYRLERISHLPPEERVQKAQEFYLYDWSKTSSFYAQKGYYQWMADQLGKYVSPKLVLDIGCGTGAGLICLVKKFGCEIIAIEENKHCIAEASKRLHDAGINVNIIERIEPFPKPLSRNPFIYQNGYHSEIELNHNSQVTIIQSDWYETDEILLQFLKGYQFDAMTVWLIGTHILHQYSMTLPQWIQSNEGLRLGVQNKAYEIADEILSSKGVLHIVDRAPRKQFEEQPDNWKLNHEDQASVTSLKVLTIEHMEYEEAPEGIPMTIGDNPASNLGTPIFVSICSLKP